MAECNNRNATCKDCLHVNVCIFRNAGEDEEICRQFINKADVAEVRHGKMEHIADFGRGVCFGYCSVCRAEHRADNPTALKIAYNHCRWCGAKLDGKGENDA